MPLESPVTIATFSDSLLIIHHVLNPTPRTPNLHRCELRLARMKISVYVPYAKECFETARQHSRATQDEGGLGVAKQSCKVEASSNAKTHAGGHSNILICNSPDLTLYTWLSETVGTVRCLQASLSTSGLPVQPPEALHGAGTSP